MENTEIIKALRLCAKSGNVIDYCELGDNNDCLYLDNCGDCIDNLLRAAADALEAADEKIADYIAAIEALDDSNDAYIKENEQLKKRIAELEAQIPKRGEWIRHGTDEDEFCYYECPLCGFIGIDWNYCPNCGARMRGEHDADN